MLIALFPVFAHHISLLSDHFTMTTALLTAHQTLLCAQCTQHSTAHQNTRHASSVYCAETRKFNFYISATKIPPLQKCKKNVSIKNACCGLQLLIQLEPRVAPESSGALITTLKTDKVSGHCLRGAYICKLYSTLLLCPQSTLHCLHGLHCMAHA